MGSPITEQGRQEDEVEHKVTLSAFKMSKYCITVEQYNVFSNQQEEKCPGMDPIGGKLICQCHK